MRTYLLLASALLAGCGAAESAPATAGAGPSSAPAECTATTGDKLPAGWVETGATLQVTLKDKKPAGIEGHPKDGPVHPVPMPPEGQEKEAMAQEVCRLGGLLAVVDRSAAQTRDGAVVLRVARPAAPSEKADLALFCSGPPDPRMAGGNFDASQMRTLAMMGMGEVLTTPRWRSWLVAQGRRVRAAEGPDKDKIYGEMVAELRAAGAPQDCWFTKAITAR